MGGVAEPVDVGVGPDESVDGVDEEADRERQFERGTTERRRKRGRQHSGEATLRERVAVVDRRSAHDRGDVGVAVVAPSGLGEVAEGRERSHQVGQGAGRLRCRVVVRRRELGRGRVVAGHGSVRSELAGQGVVLQGRDVIGVLEGAPGRGVATAVDEQPHRTCSHS